MRDPRLEDHIDNNAEALKQLALVIVRHFPAMHEDLVHFFSEWNRISKEIESEHSEEQCK